MYLGRCSSALSDVLALDFLDPLCLVVDDTFDLCLVETVDDHVPVFRHVNCT